jgi:predicted MFS family arabinose efflux permease
MASTVFPKLAVATVAVHVADQMMLAMLPLLLIASGQSATTVSAVVAAHAAAWLVVSLPGGVMADTFSRRTMMMAGASTIVFGASLGAATLSFFMVSPWLLGISAFSIASGVVLLVLAVFALVPRHVARAQISSANAVLEFGRAVVCIAAPLISAQLVAHRAGILGFGLAFCGGLVALLASRRLPIENTAAPSSTPLLAAIREGAAFVFHQPLLRAIALCAVAWNAAFFALTAVFAVYASQQLEMSIAAIGTAWSVYGIGLLLGSLIAPVLIARMPTGWMFVFGPLSCCLGLVAMMAFAGYGLIWTVELGVARFALGPWPVMLGFFCLGFGPMTWLVLQTSARQIVTPAPLLGRVGATISMAIYGVRPIGALLAGSVAASFGLRAAMWMAVALFCLSAIAMLFSEASRLKELPRPVADDEQKS